MLKDTETSRHIEIDTDELDTLDDLFTCLRCAIISGDEQKIQHTNNMLTIWISRHTSTSKPIHWKFLPESNTLRH